MDVSYLDHFAEILAVPPLGQVELLVSTDPPECLSALSSACESTVSDVRVLACLWESLVNPHGLIDETLDRLASLALAIWPHWYTADGSGIEESPALAFTACLHRARSAGLGRTVNSTWLSSASQLCLQAKVPRVSAYSNATQAEQLSLVFAPSRLMLVFAAVSTNQPSGALLNFARVAEWFAKETGAAIVALVPRELADSPELESISFRRVSVGTVIADTAPPEVGPQANDATHPTPGIGKAWIVTPIIGVPHPNSTGEQLLWAAICKDQELAGLFECNQRVTGHESSKYLVDLLWREGKLVVEVDGYYWHSSPAAFARDRLRDFHVLVRGYRVLRLPHDEVVADVCAVLERIRQVVRFIREH